MQITKNDPISNVIGNVEELICSIGIVSNYIWAKPDISECLLQIQNDLCDIILDIKHSNEKYDKRITGEYYRDLKETMTSIDPDFCYTDEILIPVGPPASTSCYMARAICHRVDRSLYMLERINGNIPRYMKTLSDFLFLLAKISNPNEPKIWEHDNKKRTKLNKDINKDEQKTQ